MAKKKVLLYTGGFVAEKSIEMLEKIQEILTSEQVKVLNVVPTTIDDLDETLDDMKVDAILILKTAYNSMETTQAIEEFSSEYRTVVFTEKTEDLTDFIDFVKENEVFDVFQNDLIPDSMEFAKILNSEKDETTLDVFYAPSIHLEGQVIDDVAIHSLVEKIINDKVASGELMSGQAFRGLVEKQMQLYVEILSDSDVLFENSITSTQEPVSPIVEEPKSMEELSGYSEPINLTEGLSAPVGTIERDASELTSFSPIDLKKKVEEDTAELNIAEIKNAEEMEQAQGNTLSTFDIPERIIDEKEELNEVDEVVSEFENVDEEIGNIKKKKGKKNKKEKQPKEKGGIFSNLRSKEDKQETTKGNVGPGKADWQNA
ncbi:MAG: hypothetical protein LBV67_06300 [Streptococcaceae bacterium]|jgi:hypothetical protein|nr:hypothetical protein [Streptococcaceae bacterium]